MTHRRIIHEILNKKITILAGAGVSRDSGLPVVSDFYDAFLPIFFDSKDSTYLIRLIRKRRIPFERMMEHILNYTGNDYSLLDIFSNGSPNDLHNLIAYMMVQNWTSELYTTNFDCLIENSLDIQGLKRNADYECLYDEKGFSKLSRTGIDKKVLKIHGSIDKKESIRTTLETITSTKNLSRRKPLLERLFSTGQHEVVIVIGYSFSDVFDINEFINKLPVDKLVIVIKHQRGKIADRRIKLLRNVSKNNPFYGKDLRGYIICIDTFLFMSGLVLAKYGRVPTNLISKTVDWRNYLSVWASKYDMSRRAYIAGGICNSMNEFKVASKYIVKAFQMANTHDVDYYTSLVNQYTLTQFRQRKSLKECHYLVSLCKYALELIDYNKNNIPVQIVLKRSSDLNYRIGRIYEDGYQDYSEAKRYYFVSYRLEFKIGDIREMSKILHQIGLVCSNLNEINLALKCFKRSVKFKRKCGYIGGVTRTYYTMAAAIFENDKRKIKRAEKYLKKAEESEKKVGEIDLIHYINNLRGVFLINRGAYTEASSLLQRNIEMLRGLAYTEVKATAHYNLARCEIRLREYTEAKIRLKKNLSVVSELGMSSRVFRNRQELAIVYLLLSELDECYECLKLNLNLIDKASNEEKGYYFFYVSLYYKKFNLSQYYREYFEVSKHFFNSNSAIGDFYRINREIGKKVISDPLLSLDSTRFINWKGKI